LEDEKQIHAASNNTKEEQDEMEDWGSTVFGAAHCLIWASPGGFLLVETCFNYFFGTRNRESEQTVTMTHALSCFVEVSIAFVGYDGELSYQRRPEVLGPPISFRTVLRGMRVHGPAAQGSPVSRASTQPSILLRWKGEETLSLRNYLLTKD